MAPSMAQRRDDSHPSRGRERRVVCCAIGALDELLSEPGTALQLRAMGRLRAIVARSRGRTKGARYVAPEVRWEGQRDGFPEPHTFGGVCHLFSLQQGAGQLSRETIEAQSLKIG